SDLNSLYGTNKNGAGTVSAPLLFLRPLHTEIELPDQVVVVEFISGTTLESDLAVDDDIAAIGDADGLGEILLGHQHRQLVVVLELLDGVDSSGDQKRREADRRLVDQQDARRQH